MKMDSISQEKPLYFPEDMPQGSLIAVGTTKVQANQTENTEDLIVFRGDLSRRIG